LLDSDQALFIGFNIPFSLLSLHLGVGELLLSLASFIGSGGSLIAFTFFSWRFTVAIVVWGGSGFPKELLATTAILAGFSFITGMGVFLWRSTATSHYPSILPWHLLRH
jgi:hypothetical protein